MFGNFPPPQDEHSGFNPCSPYGSLVCCRNPALALARAYKRESLLAAIEEDLAKIAKSVESGRLKEEDKIGVRVGKVIGKYKVGKHFTWEVKNGSFSFRMNEQ
jgi:hypothetical protein